MSSPPFPSHDITISSPEAVNKFTGGMFFWGSQPVLHASQRDGLQGATGGNSNGLANGFQRFSTNETKGFPWGAIDS